MSYTTFDSRLPSIFFPPEHRHRYHIVFGHFDWTPSQKSSMLLYFRAYLQTSLSSLYNSCSTLFHRNIVTSIDSSSRFLIYTQINNHACLYFLFNSNYAIYAEISRESGAKAKNTSKWIPIFTEYHRYIFARTRVCVSPCMRDWCMFAREYLHLHGKYDELCRTWFSTHVLPTSPCSRLAPFPDIYRLEPQPWPFIHHDDNENGVDEKDLLVSR